MSRQSIVGQIYGYGVSLLAVLIILFTIHGIVNNVFRVINPAAGGAGEHVLMMHRFSGPGMGGPGMMGPSMGMPGGGAMMWGRHNRMFGQQPTTGASSAPTTATAPGNAMQPGMGGPMAMHASMIGEGRFNAVRMLVIDIIMLIVGIVLFQRTWAWVHSAA